LKKVVTESARAHAAVAVLIVVALALVGLAGCGSSGKKSSTTTGGFDAVSGKLVVLVTNDDGFDAPGIDQMVKSLQTLPNIEIHVVAPATNESGTGSKTTPGTVAQRDAKTLSDFPAIAVSGYPVDSVRVAIDELHLRPNLVVSGINLGQNAGPVATISGTVGAARAAAARGVAALAVSQGLGNPVRYDVGAKYATDWIKQHRAALVKAGGRGATSLTNINAPSCATGAPRGPVQVPPAGNGAGNPLATQNCTSSVTKPTTDVEALTNGFVAITMLSAA
jgi:5'-nucleotidase